MNIKRRIVFVNNQIKEKEEKDLKNIMSNISLKFCKKEKKATFFKMEKFCSL